MKRRRTSIPENRVDLEIEIQDSTKQIHRANPFYASFVCVCGLHFSHTRVPKALIQDLRCPECKKNLTTKATDGIRN